jgi:hypothetical protein
MIGITVCHETPIKERSSDQGAADIATGDGNAADASLRRFNVQCWLRAA